MNLLAQIKKKISQKVNYIKNTNRLFFNNQDPVVKVWGFFIKFLLSLLLYIIAVDINFLWLFGKMPGFQKLENPKIDVASEIYSSDGVKIGKYFIENRTPVEYTQISPYVIKALIAVEDVRFYEHSGIDMQAIFSVIYNLITGGQKRGGSTITQQLAKNLFKIRGEGSKGLLGFVPIINTLIFKTKEWILSVRLERAYSKQEIITMYLNTVDFGSRAFGIKTAAQTYFNTTPMELSIQEAATLVGLLKATTTYSPILNPKNCLNRRNLVLEQMAKYGIIDYRTADSVSKLPIELKFYVEKHYDGVGTYFRSIMNNYLKEWCKKFGYDLYTDGLKIYSTIDSRIQKLAEEAVEEHMRTLQKAFYKHWKGQNPWVDENNREIPGYIEQVAKRTPRYKALVERYGENHDSVQIIMNTPIKMTVFSWDGEKDTILSPMDSIRYYKHFLHAGFLVIDHQTGHIKAWVGGINYKYFKYDHVRQASRQPGSTFKPFVYLAAIDKGYSPCSRLVDKPYSIKYYENGELKEWSPRNSDRVFTYDTMTLRHAMARSVNSITAQLTDLVGWDTVIEYAKKLGIKSPLKPVPSIGLGSSDVNLYELVAAYATFPNRGVYTRPMFIKRIEDKNGKVIYEFVPYKEQVLSEETAWLMLHMLKGGLEEPYGTSQALFQYDLFKGNEFGGKTGTSNNYSDGWFIGITKDWVAGVWVGGDDRCIHFRTSAMGEGARTALPIFGKFMEKVYANKDLNITMGYFPKPTVKITKPWNCTTPWKKTRKDTTTIQINDSTSLKDQLEINGVEND